MNLKRNLTILASAALLSPVALAAGAGTASAAGFCDGYARTTTRPISPGQTDTPWSYLWQPQPGTYSICLDGPARANLDLTLQRFDPATATWVDVAKATGPGADEILTYTDTIGSQALYSVDITAVRGGGQYTLGFNHSNDA